MPTLIRNFHSDDLAQVRDIFFESSIKKTFKDEAEKEQFFRKYLGYYLDKFPELAFVAGDKKVLGYLVGALNSQNEELMSLQPHMKSFEKHFKKYPAHLHINCHFEARGQGIGHQLVKAYEAKLKDLHVSGLHIMTSFDALNKSFYSSLGFHDEILEDFQGFSILMMGKAL